jgi:hypothetical protein
VKRFIAPLLFTVLCSAAPADASQFTLDSFSVALRNADPGLVVWANPSFSDADITFDLSSVGQSVSKTLFRIGTNETAFNLEDDLKQYAIQVAFNFSAPAVSGTALGVTGAGWLIKGFGYVDWKDPLKLAFGSTGVLAVTLQDTKFGLPGSADVKATFTLLKADTPTFSTPEPGVMLLLLIGAGAVGLARRRKALHS